MKPFKTIDEQIEILSNRNMDIGDYKNQEKIKEVLKSENYYSIINGYKDLFLLRRSDKDKGIEEKYKDGTTFWEIYALYKIDKLVQIDLLELILNYESSLKTKSAYYFGKEYKDKPHAYLDYNSYEKREDALWVISSISNIISRNSKKDHFKHYINKYKYIPIWVVITSFTFGNLQYFYSAIPSSIQNNISKDYSIRFKQEYNKQVLIQPDVLSKANHILNFYRNICAHREVLFNFRVKKFSKDERIFKSAIFNGENIYYKNDGSLFNALAYLSLLTPKKEFTKFIKKVEKYLDYLSTEIKTFEKNELYECLGFKNQYFEDGFKILKEICY